MSYFSSVKISVTAASGDSSAFNAPELYTLKRGLIKNSTHTPSKAPGIVIADFKKIIDFLVNLQPSPHVLVVALLLSYFTLARQSNLVLTSTNLNDCHLVRDALLVTIKTTKMHYAMASCYSFLVLLSSCCLVEIYKYHEPHS